MKILQIVPSLSSRTGGPAKAVLELSEALAARGEEVFIFTTDHDWNGAASRLSGDNGDVTIQYFKLKRPRSYFYAPSLWGELERSVRNFDVVHIHGVWLYPALAASRICQKENVPYVVRPCGMLTPYCLSHHRFRKKIYDFLVERKNLRCAAAIHFTTWEEQERSRSFGLDHRAVVIPLGLQVRNYPNLIDRGTFREQYVGFRDKKVILFLGRLNFKKGLDLLVEAFSQIVERDQTAHLVIAGPDDEGYGQKVKRWIFEKGIEEQVTFTGFLDGKEKLSLLSACDIFCLPSHDENFGLSVLEAMAAGLPVVVSDQVSLQGEIKGSQAGIVVACDVGDLKTALERLLNDAPLRQEMGRKGRALVQEKYSWEEIVEKISQLYKRLALSRLRSLPQLVVGV